LRVVNQLHKYRVPDLRTSPPQHTQKMMATHKVTCDLCNGRVRAPVRFVLAFMRADAPVITP
jgi:hypothetical protein